MLYVLFIRRVHKTAKSDLASSYLSVCPHSRTPLPLDRFSLNLIFEYYQKTVENIRISLKLDKNKGSLHEDQNTFFIISHSVLLRMKNISDKSCRENQNTFYIQ